MTFTKYTKALHNTEPILLVLLSFLAFDGYISVATASHKVVLKTHLEGICSHSPPPPQTEPSAKPIRCPPCDCSTGCGRWDDTGRLRGVMQPTAFRAGSPWRPPLNLILSWGSSKCLESHFDNLQHRLLLQVASFQGRGAAML